MIGSFFTRGLVMIFGYAYPAYECFKMVEKNKPDIELLRFWCQYWILVALLTVSERIGDAFISWVPMYSEAKLALFLYLWWPKTKGATYVYDCFFKPIIANHEAEIDRGMLELRIRAENMAVSYSRRAASYIQTRTVDIFHFVALLSTPAPPAQPSQQAAKVCQPPAPRARKSSLAKPQTDRPLSPASSSSSSQNSLITEEEVGPSESQGDEPSTGVSNAQKLSKPKALVRTSKSLETSRVEAIQIDSASSQEMTKEEGVRVTRARSRRTHSAPNQ
ncbi:membrane traffic protein [Lithospermum erythrorhizon]|uniref:HVA22-like protein n=1 Tax=Lithospermum erythrorhizon TaxID=34254 RepID=A0AAV3NIY9_LITER